MKKIVEYQCDICKRTYNTPDAAAECEVSGVFNPDAYPVGMMYSYIHNYFVGIFAIPPKGARADGNSPHNGSIWTWACRTTGGDTLGDERCGSGSLVKSGEKYLEEFVKRNILKKEHIGCPEYNRMVAYLKSQNIRPFYYSESGKLINV